MGSVSGLGRSGKASIGRSLVFLLALLLFFYWSGPVKIASARDSPRSVHSQVEVEFPRAPDLPNNREICFIFFFLPCMKIYNPGGQRIERAVM